MIYMSDGSIGTPRNPNDLPLITGIFQDNNSMSVGWKIGTYGIAYTIEQYCVSEGNTAAPKMQIAYMAANQRIMIRYATGAWSDNWQETVKSVAGKTGTVTLTKSDVGLSAVANERQYSASNPQVAQLIWSGSATSIPVSTFSSISSNRLIIFICGLNISSGYRDIVFCRREDIDNTLMELSFAKVSRNSTSDAPDMSGFEVARSGSNIIIDNRVRWVWSGTGSSHTISKYTTPARNFLQIYAL